MIFFEFSFRREVQKDELLKKTLEYFNGEVQFSSFEEFYGNESNLQSNKPCIVFKFYYSEEGFKTFFKGEAYNVESRFNEFGLAVFYSKELNTEVVIGDFTGLSDFLMIKSDGNIYRVNPIGIGDTNFNKEVFDIDYASLRLADDLISPRISNITNQQS